MSADGETTPLADEAFEIRRLAAMDPVLCELERDEVAKRFGRTPAVFGRAVTAARKIQTKARTQTIEAPSLFEDTQPWDMPIDAPALFDEMLSLVERFTVCDRTYAVAATLWCGMSWLMEHLRVAPFAMITAPTLGCGKTVMLEVMSLMSYRSFLASSTTEAVVFRLLDRDKVTLFLDESDRSLSVQRQELIGILNASYSRRSAVTSRCEGDDHTPRTFVTWGAKAFAGIGSLEDTLLSRSIRIVMRRKLANEKIENIRKPSRSNDAMFASVRRKLARFAADVDVESFERDPMLPPGLENRGEELWMAICTVGELVGGHWPAMAREAAAHALATDVPAQSNDEELLYDVRDAFVAQDKDFLPTDELIHSLCRDPEAPWATLNRGQPITPRQLSKRLKGFGGLPEQKRIGVHNVRGYYLPRLADAFDRYQRPAQAEPDPVSATAATAATAHMPLRKDLNNSGPVADVAAVAAKLGKAPVAATSHESNDDWFASGKV